MKLRITSTCYSLLVTRYLLYAKRYTTRVQCPLGLNFLSNLYETDLVLTKWVLPVSLASLRQSLAGFAVS